MKKCAVLIFFLLSGCASFVALPQTPLVVHDAHSFSNSNDVRVRSLGLSLTVDFAHRRLAGTATLDIEQLTGVNELVLDTRDLDIHWVRLDDGSAAAFTLGPDTPDLGRALHIPITRRTKRVIVDYSTRPTAAALQWLDPEQTAGKKYPYLFTQSESILARTWVPCQDTPSVRMTYGATIRVPVGMMALMSAVNPQKRSADGIYTFTMPQPIPSYLLALAVGDIDFRPLDERSGVYAEPSVLEAAAWELADTPKMIDAAEKLYGPYRWGRYDILVMPPSFPFGGMENPRLTFATPAVIAGDRSLVSLVAHELSHSWSGNLVTNATWDDFWLNEGVTTYFERRIDEELYGRDYSEMLAALGLGYFKAAVEEHGADSPLTKLHTDLEGHDPDDAFSDIPYEKGYSLLRLLEESVGREAFDAFLHDYFTTYAFQSMTSDRFVAYLDDHLLRRKPDLQKRVQEWVYETGMPADTPAVVSERFNRVDAMTAAFIGGAPASSIDPKAWSAQEWIRFLDALPPNLGAGRLADLDAAFHLTSTGNLDVLRSWLLLAVRNNYREAFPRLENFLVTIGRLWYITPIYKELAKTPEGLAFAKHVYEKARPRYHPAAQQAVDAILNAK